MLLLDVLVICLIITVIVYIRLIIKRLFLLRKIIKNVNATGMQCEKLKPFCYSVFLPGKSADIFIMDGGEKRLLVQILTTPFCKVRYHFDNDCTLEIIKSIKQMFVVNPRRPRPGAQIDSSRTIKRYKINTAVPEEYSEAEKTLLVHPAPRELSKVEGNQIVAVGNGDTVYGYKISSASHFIENYIGY